MVNYWGGFVGKLNKEDINKKIFVNNCYILNLSIVDLKKIDDIWGGIIGNIGYDPENIDILLENNYISINIPKINLVGYKNSEFKLNKKIIQKNLYWNSGFINEKGNLIENTPSQNLIDEIINN